MRVRLLGGLEVRTPDDQDVTPPGRKLRALIACLALPPGTVWPRERLTALLWGDRDEGQARGSLRQDLAELRRRVGASRLQATRETVALDARAMAVDAVEFAQSAEAGDLARAAELYRGDLLDGVILPDAGFADWLLVERTRLRDLAISVLSRLLAGQSGEAAIATAERLLQLDPVREEAHRALMQLYAAHGDRARALRQYQFCRDALQNELGVRPEPETEQLYQSIKATRATVGRTSSPAPESALSAAANAPSDAALRAQEMEAPRPPSKPSVAVLPFDNMTGDPEQQYFSDGITEDIITELSRFRTLFVIAPNSSFQYRGKAIDVTRMGRELGVRYVVEGSVRRSTDRIRITAQLVEAASGKHLWAERYDRDLRDTFAVQDEVTRMIVSTLVIRLEDEGLDAAKRKRPENMLAYDYWLRGKNFLGLWNREALLDARALFEKAIEIDPNYARAYVGLALTYEWAAFYTAWSGGDPTAREMAERYALRSVSLDPTDHQPHVALGWIYQERRDFERSRRHLDRAEALNPNDADMLINKAMMLSCQSEPDRAIELAQSAIRLNPYHPDWYLSYYSHCLMVARRYDEAMALRALATSTLPEARAYMAVLCVLLGRMDEARRHADELVANFSSHWLGEPTVSFFAKLIGGYKNQADADILTNALRKAGLPE